ncbi:MAG: FliM/FliN family flagellar motor switch protein [Pyrinomonadaceae bacterium]
MKEECEKIIESWRNVLDVPVTLDVELGRTRLKVSEILDLKENSVIQLSRSTGEGVDVRADNQPLVRGEIIVIEDRAGVRVSEIIIPKN